jgi:hypothetical protein
MSSLKPIRGRSRDIENISSIGDERRGRDPGIAE